MTHRASLTRPSINLGDRARRISHPADTVPEPNDAQADLRAGMGCLALLAAPFVPTVVLVAVLPGLYGLDGPGFIRAFGLLLLVASALALVTLALLGRSGPAERLEELDTEPLDYVHVAQLRDADPCPAIFAAVSARGAIQVQDSKVVRTALDLDAADLSVYERALLEATPLDGATVQAIGADARVTHALGCGRAWLVERGLLTPASDASRYGFLVGLPLQVVLLLGVARISQGVASGRPVGFLVLLVLLAAALLVVAWVLGRRLATTARGRRLLAASESRLRATAARAAVDRDAAGSLADIGLAALLLGSTDAGVDPALIALTTSPASSRSGGDGGGGGCGGGGCGGGCGGCGGG